MRFSVYPHGISKTESARVTELTQKCSTLTSGNALILESKFNVTRHKKTVPVWALMSAGF